MTSLVNPLFQQYGNMIRFWAKDVSNLGFILTLKRMSFSLPPLICSLQIWTGMNWT